MSELSSLRPPSLARTGDFALLCLVGGVVGAGAFYFLDDEVTSLLRKHRWLFVVTGATAGIGVGVLLAKRWTLFTQAAAELKKTTA